MCATVGLAAALAAGGAGAARETTGLRGRVLLDPAVPVCRLGTPCARPLPRFGLVFRRAGRVVARIRTDGDGRYRVALAVGLYTVRAARAPRIGRGLEPSRVRVAPGAPRRVDLRFDGGIR